MLDTVERAQQGTLYREASAKIYQMPVTELATYLKNTLGRPFVARLTKTADPSSVTRWSKGEDDPDAPRVERMRIAGVVHVYLTDAFRNSDNASDWLVGRNPDLKFMMPIDLIRDGDYPPVVAAAQDIANLCHTG